MRLDVDLFIKTQPTGYLFNSVIFQLLEILVWFKSYCDNHQDYEKNRAIAILKPVESTIIEGIIEQDKNRNYHCEDIILTYRHVKEKGYGIGDKIRILNFTTNTNNKTKDFYPKSALTSEKI